MKCLSLWVSVEPRCPNCLKPYTPLANSSSVYGQESVLSVLNENTPPSRPLMRNFLAVPEENQFVGGINTPRPLAVNR